MRFAPGRDLAGRAVAVWVQWRFEVSPLTARAADPGG